MSRLILNESAAPSAPSSSKVALYADQTASPILKAVIDDGQTMKLIDNKLLLTNKSTGNQTGFASDTYLSGSSISIPVGRLIAAGFKYRLRFDMVKTAAGTAQFTITIRVGTAGSTSDTSRLSFAFAAGTAAVDTGVFVVEVLIRNAGASAVGVGYCSCQHHLAATGLISTGASGSGILIVTSSSFDATVESLIIGASVNGGSSFSGTNVLVEAEGENLEL